ncbi:MAG: hypothetical protein ABGZ37_00770, partial [Akkermansiaceae bacterium]
MEATLEQVSVFEQAPGELEGMPAWFNALRQEGWKRFQELDMPSRRDEQWRFAKLKQLNFEGVRFPDAEPPAGHRGAAGL